MLQGTDFIAIIMLGEGMKKLALAVVAGALSSEAFASDPTALYYFAAFQGLTWVWPFILPALFLRGSRSKLRLYLALLLVPLGILEIIDIPVMVTYGLAAWVSFDVSNLASMTVFGRHLVALCLSLWFLPRFRRLVLQGLESGSSAQPGAAADRAASPPGG
jgi:predicted membrane-bound dolichyl-phosphate-mannose-protein mannosyltransferase